MLFFGVLDLLGADPVAGLRDVSPKFENFGGALRTWRRCRRTASDALTDMSSARRWRRHAPFTNR